MDGGNHLLVPLSSRELLTASSSPMHVIPPLHDPSDMWATSAWSVSCAAPDSDSDGRVEWLERRLSLLERRAEAARQQRVGKQQWPNAIRKRSTDRKQDAHTRERASQDDTAMYGSTPLPLPLPPHSLPLTTLSAFHLDRLLLAYSNSLVAASARSLPAGLPLAAAASSSDRAAVASLSCLDAAIAAIRHQRAEEDRRARRERLIAAMVADKTTVLEQQHAILERERSRRREEHSFATHRLQTPHSSRQSALDGQVRADMRGDSEQWLGERREAHWRTDERREASRYWSKRAQRERLEKRLGAGQTYECTTQHNQEEKEETELKQEQPSQQRHPSTATATATELAAAAPAVANVPARFALKNQTATDGGMRIDHIQRNVDSGSPQHNLQQHHSQPPPTQKWVSQSEPQKSNNEPVEAVSQAEATQQQWLKQPAAQQRTVIHKDAVRSEDEEGERKHDSLSWNEAGQAAEDGSDDQQQSAMEAEAEQTEAVAPIERPNVSSMSAASRRTSSTTNMEEQRRDNHHSNTVSGQLDGGSGGLVSSAIDNNGTTGQSQSPSTQALSSTAPTMLLLGNHQSAASTASQSKYNQRPQLSDGQMRLTAHHEDTPQQARQCEIGQQAKTSEAAVDATVADSTTLTAAAQGSGTEQQHSSGDPKADNSKVRHCDHRQYDPSPASL